MTGRTFKEAFFRSGKPLEEEVGHLFREARIDDYGSYEFKREGSDLTEEVDRRGLKVVIGHEGALPVNLFVECKQTRGKWLFFDAPQKVVEESANLVLSERSRLHLEKPSLGSPLQSHGGRAFMEHPGGKWDVDDRAVDNAIRQAVLGASDFFARKVAEAVAFGNDTVEIFVPVVVTTSEVVRLKRGRLGNLEAARDDLSDVTAPAGSVTVNFAPSPWMREAFDGFLARYLNECLATEHADPNSLGNWGGSTDQVLNALSQRYWNVPSRCLVTSLAQFPTDLDAVLAGIEKAAQSNDP